MSYRFQHSIDVSISRRDAWNFWTNVDNWAFDPAVESVRLDGEFVAGSRGVTKTSGGEAIEWKIASLEPGKAALIEIPLKGAAAYFDWQFKAVDENEARFTQTITIEGEKADDYLPMVGKDFEDGVRQGMKNLALEMVKAAN